MSRQGKGFTFTLAAAFCAASVYATGKWAMAGISPVHLVALIFSIAAIFMIVWSGLSGQWRQLLHCSTTGWIYALLFTGATVIALLCMWSGLKHLDPTIASFIGRLQTLVAVFLGYMLLKERLGWVEGIGGIVVIAGVVVIRITFDVELGKWFWVMVASGVGFGLVEVTGKFAVRHMDPLPLNTFRNTVVALVYLFLFSFENKPLFELGGYWYGVLLVAFAGPVFSRFFFLSALKNIAVSQSTLINQSQPLFVFIIAYALFGTIPTLREWIGGLLIVVGCVVMIAGAMRTPKTSPPM